MKKMMVLGLGLMTVLMVGGCTKKEKQVSVDEPIVTEETAATAVANMEIGSGNMEALEPSALEAASTAVAQTVAAVIENPTSQQIQEALKGAGYYDGNIDGKIGPKTKRAIETFQKDNGLKADGKVGSRTWAKLGVHLAADAVGQGASAPVTEPILGTDLSYDEDHTTSN